MGGLFCFALLFFGLFLFLFAFSTLNILLHYLLSCIIFNKNSTVILIFESMCAMCFLCLAILRFSFLSLVSVNFISICFGSIILFMSPVLGICWASWIFGFVYLKSDLQSFGSLFLQIFYPLRIPSTYFFGCLKLSHSSMMLYLFFFLPLSGNFCLFVFKKLFFFYCSWFAYF